MVYINHFRIYIWHSRAQGIYHMQSMKPFRSLNPNTWKKGLLLLIVCWSV